MAPIVWGLLLLLPTAVRAQGQPPESPPEPEPAERRLARTLRDQAYADLARERYAEGIAKLQEAYAAVPNPGLLLNVAIAYRRWGDHCTESLQALERFEAVCGVDDCAFHDEGRAQRVLLEASCTGEVRILSSPVRAQVQLDARPGGLTPLTLRLEPGPYTLTATAADAATRRVDLEVRPGQLQEIRLVWPSPEKKLSGRRRAAWAAVGVAASSLVVGGIFTGLAVDSGSRLSDTLIDQRLGVDSRRDREWGAAAVGYGFSLASGVVAAGLLATGDDER